MAAGQIVGYTFLAVALLLQAFTVLVLLGLRASSFRNRSFRR
jgi:hypothetical protein